MSAGWEHELKVWPDYFTALLDGRKTFEWRKDDRDFREGDTLYLREWYPGNAHHGEEAGYTGREMTRTISYIMRGGFNLPDGYAVLALSPPSAPAEGGEPQDATRKELSSEHSAIVEGLYSLAVEFENDGMPRNANVIRDLAVRTCLALARPTAESQDDARRLYALGAHLEFAITNLREAEQDGVADYLQDCLNRSGALKLRDGETGGAER